MSTNPYESSKVPSVSAPPSPSIREGMNIGIATIQLLIGAVLGFLIWAATAPAEAWDINPLYSTCLLGAGLISSFGRRREFYWGVPGVYAGQVIAMHLLIPTGGVPLLPAFLAVFIYGTLPALVGSLLGLGIGAILGSLLRRTPA